MGTKERSGVNPILFVNAPIHKLEEDIFHIDVQVEELQKAVKEGANFIGIFSEFGGGKTSVVQNFAKASRYKICNICLWNYEGFPKNDQSSQISSFTQSFLYQLSKTVGGGFSRNVNRMMSKNYKQLSFSTDMGKLKKILLGMILTGFLFLMAVGIVCKETEVTSIGQAVAKIYTYITAFGSNSMVVAAGILLFILFFFRDDSAMISWKGDGIERELGEADAYEIFEKIIGKAKRNFMCRIGRRRYVLNIEDLDRVTDKQDVCEFLKSLYKFNNLLERTDMKKFIFIISLSMKSYMETQAENLCNKLFDYAMVIRPYNREKVVELFMNLIEEGKGKITDKAQCGGATWKEWIIKGEELGIRTIKSRINTALAIYDELSAENNETGQKTNGIDFEKCAIAAYLESAFPVDMYEFTVHPYYWKTVLNKLKEYEEGINSDGKAAFDMEIDSYPRFSRGFRKEIKILFDGILSSQDYWRYFYRNPKC